MADEFKYGITIATTATGTGVKETLDGMAAVERSTASLNVTQQRSQAEFEGLADKARVSQFAFYDLDAEMRKTGQATATVTSGMTQLERPTRNNAQALLMFSQGFEDAAYGIRGVLNNIPGLIIAMGGTAGLAGAISIAAVGLSQIIPLFTKVEEKAADVADRIKAVSDNMGEAETERFEAVGDAIEAAADSAAALKQEFDQTAQAEREFSISALGNAEKLEKAQRLIAEALGLQVDSFRELESIAAREAEKRRVAAEQALAAEQLKLRTASEAVTVAADALQAQEQREAIETANLVNLRAELDELRKKRDELEKIAKAQTILVAGDFGSFVDPDQRLRNERAVEARRELDNPAFKTELAGTQSRVDRLESLVEQITRTSTGTVAQAEVALQAAQTKAADVQQAVAVNIERIQETLNADDLLARSQVVAQTGERLAAEITKAFGAVETNNATAAAAKESLLQAAAVGGITQNEVAGTAADIRTLMGELQSGGATTRGNIQELLQIQQTFTRISTQQQSEIRALRAQVESLEGRL